MNSITVLWQKSFAAEPESIGAARVGIRKALANAGFTEELVDDAVLLASELATNALRHGSEAECSSFEVRLVPDPVGLYIEVTDASQRMPQPREARRSDEGGRGLLLLALLGHRWGVTVTTHAGKATWVLVPTPLPEVLRWACQAARRRELACA